MYVNSLYIVKKTKKKTLRRASFGRFISFLMGLNSSLSSPTSEQVCQKGGGSRFGPLYRPLLTDYGLKGFFTSGSTQAWMKFVSSIYLLVQLSP